MKKKTVSTIIKTVIIAVILMATISFAIFSIVSKKSKAIPEGIMGNTSGNINNRGRFCEADGYIYFANPYDSQKLYKMKNDLTEPKALTELSAEFINVYGNDIFFYQTSDVGNQILGLGSQYGICKCNTSGTGGTSFIDKAACNSLILYGPDIYYQRYDADEGLRLYKASAKAGSRKEISKKEVFVSCPVKGQFYCSDTENMFYLSAYDIKSDTFKQTGNIRAYNASYDDGYIYFMNLEDNYNIYRVRLSAPDSPEKIVNEKVETFNVYGNDIFYQKSSEDNPGLYHKNIMSGEETLCLEGDFSCINCTSTYTFFYDFYDKAKVYCVPTSGGSAISFTLP